MTVREVARRAFRENLPTLVASAVGGLLAGGFLETMRGELRAVPGLLVLVPALLATRGNVYGALGARVSTALHQGLIRPRFRTDDDRLMRAVAAAFLNGVFISGFAAVAAFAVLVGLGRNAASLWVLLAIALLAGALSGIALTGIVVGTVFLGFRRGYNPDTLVGPVVTTTGDIFGMAFLYFATRLVLRLGGGG